ncbi:MAG: amino-acid N-acetyltransferase [Kineosporiaceae bacterium]
MSEVGVQIRSALPRDVPRIAELAGAHVADRRLLAKDLVTLYEDVQEFVVTESAGQVVGAGALHVMWADLGEIRSLVVDPAARGRGVGAALVASLMARARALELRRLFCLTFEVAFFERLGFRPVEGPAVTPDIYEEMLRSHDDGVAEFLDLARVKPNTLGNTRMICDL